MHFLLTLIILIIASFTTCVIFLRFLINRLINYFVNKERQKLQKRNTYTLLNRLEDIKIKPLLGTINSTGENSYFSFVNYQIELYKSFMIIYGTRHNKFKPYQTIHLPTIIFFSAKPLKRFENYRQFQLIKVTYKQLFKDEIELRIKTSNKDWNFINEELTLKGLSEEQKNMFEYIKLSIDKES